MSEDLKMRKKQLIFLRKKWLKIKPLEEELLKEPLKKDGLMLQKN